MKTKRNLRLILGMLLLPVIVSPTGLVSLAEAKPSAKRLAGPCWPKPKSPSHHDRILTVDVAIDGRTWRLDNGANPFALPFDVDEFLKIARGNTFIVSGAIYPANTLATGGDIGNPGGTNPPGPDQDGSIGTWVCRGTFNLDAEDIANGDAPHVTSTQFFYFDDGSVIVTDGPEGGATTLRAVLGGGGRFGAGKGECVEVPLGVNDSNLFNLRFTFQLK